jgi:ABC-type polysaccharide/polyol phosphate export permease
MANTPVSVQWRPTAQPPQVVHGEQTHTPLAGFEYDSARRTSPFVAEFLALIKYRHLVAQLISRNIKTRYKRSVLGVAWTMISPLMMMVVLSIVFSSVFNTKLENYAVFLLSALTLWGFFSQTSAGIMTDLMWGGSLISKIYIPPSVFAISAVGAGLVNIVLSLVPLLLIMLVSGVPITPAMLFLPVPLLFAVMFSLGVGLILSRLAIYFADVVEMYQILIMVWFYASPIIYPLEAIADQRRYILMLNPMVYLIEMFRDPIYLGRLPDPSVTLIAGSISLTALLVGWWYFTQKVDEFPYRV